MKVYKYRPVRVVNPTAEYHTSRLYPCQSYLLKLRKPSLFLDRCSEEAEFAVDLSSDYLIVESSLHDTDTGGKVYVINHKYDLSDWAEYGEVSLGELSIKLVGNSHEQAKPFRSTICFIQSAEDSNRVITVVNPMGHVVKVEPHQLLEVVLSEPLWNNYEPGKIEAAGFRDQWVWSEAAAAPAKDGPQLVWPERVVQARKPLKMKEVRYKIAGDRSEVITRERGPFSIKNRYGLKVNPRLSPLGKAIVERELAAEGKPLREHHYWFACTEDTLKESLNLPNDVYDVSFFCFEGKCQEATGEGLTSWRGLDVQLVVHGKNRHKMQPYYLNPDSVEHKLEVVKRSEDKGKALLTNPLTTEHVDFSQGYEEVTVEVIQPNVFWVDLDEGSRWEIKIDDSHLQPKYVRVTELTDSCRWGKRFQRFRITHDYKPKNDQETKYLGAVFISCPTKQDHHDGRKRISCWMTPGAKELATAAGGRRKEYAHAQSHGGNTWVGGKREKDKGYNGKPTVAVLKIEEIPVTDSLAGDARTRNFVDLWVPDEWCGSCLPHDYASKKKASWTSGFNSKLYQASCQSESKNGSNGSTTGTPNERSNGADAHSPTRPPFIVYNPEHLHRICLEYGQALIVRMSSPGKLLNGRAEGEYWSLTKSASVGIRVCHFKTAKVGEGESPSVYQEVMLALDKVPPAPGIHPVGCLHFECSEDHRSVFIECNVRDNKDVKTVQHDMRVVSPNRCFGSPGRKMLVTDWSHNDAIVVAPSDTFYIRTPSITSEWNQSSWRMDIQQFALPDKVWQHELLKEALKDIDIYNPWFKTLYPLQLNNSYVFRPLDVQQPHAGLILKAVAAVTDLDTLPIAKLTFSNSQHPTGSSVETPFGKVESEFRISRSMGVCVDLSGYRGKELTLSDSDNWEELNLVPDQTLVFKMTPRHIDLERGLVESPWYMGLYPPFLDFKGKRRADGCDVFEFRVRRYFAGGKEGWIRFICGSSEKSLLLKYEERLALCESCK